MDPFIVVTHPEPIHLEVRPIEAADLPADHIALGFFHLDSLLARGVVPPPAVQPLIELLSNPVTVALAVTQDDDGNVDGRLCVVLRMPDGNPPPDSEEPEEPWRTSVPDLPSGVESDEPGKPAHLALLPLGNVVRSAANRHQAELVDEARDMLQNLLAGRAQDAVSQAIDDLLDSL
jgi:hypothetical protein